MSHLNFLLADESPFIRLALQQVIKSLNPSFLTSEVTNSGGLFQHLRIAPYKILFINHQFPDMHYELLKRIRKEQEALKIVLTCHHVNASIVRFVNMEIEGFVCFNDLTEQIHEVIRTVVIGDRYYSPSIERFVNKLVLSNDVKHFSRLEKQLVYLLSRGLTTKEVAPILHKTTKTIETYRSRLLKKADVKNASELLDYFYRNNLFEAVDVMTTTKQY